MKQVATAVASEQTVSESIVPVSVGYIRLREGARPSVFHHGMEVTVHGPDPSDSNKVIVSGPGIRKQGILKSFVVDKRMPAIRESES